MRFRLPILVFALAPCATARGQDVPLPPGVTLIESAPAAKRLPPGIAVSAIGIDWTQPLLHAELRIATTREGALPPLLSALLGDSGDSADALFIQLAEPYEDGDVWKLALEGEPAPPIERRPVRGDHTTRPGPAPAAGSGASHHARVGGIEPWTLGGPAVAASGETESPLIDASARVDVRWLGHPADWRTRPPDGDVTSQAVLSALDPDTGRGVFMILRRSGSQRFPLSDLADWLEEAFAEQEWIALHSMGDSARIGRAGWQMGEGPSGPGLERAGAVMVLRGAKAGEAVDWARLGNPRLRASSAASKHPVENLVSGRVWPSPLAPTLWTSRWDGSGSEAAPTVELEFAKAPPIEAIRLVFAQAAGWTEHFNPHTLRVRIREAGSGTEARPIEIIEHPGPHATIEFPSPRRIEWIGIEFVYPRRLSLPGPARLAAVQAIGPYEAER